MTDRKAHPNLASVAEHIKDSKIALLEAAALIGEQKFSELIAKLDDVNTTLQQIRDKLEDDD